MSIEITPVSAEGKVERQQELISRLIQRNGDLRLRVADLEKQLLEADIQLARALERNDWIPVEERLPAAEDASLNALSPRVEAIVSGAAVNLEGRWFLYLTNCEVTHWRPLYTQPHEAGRS